MCPFRACYLIIRNELWPNQIPFLVDALDDRSELVRAVVISSLVRNARESVEPLIHAAQDDCPNEREGAVICLGRIAKGNTEVALIKDTIPVLLTALTDDSPRVRANAARALWFADKNSDQVVPVLIQLWQDDDLDTRYVVAGTLEDIGPKAKDAIPTLRNGLNHKNGLVRSWARAALQKIDP